MIHSASLTPKPTAQQARSQSTPFWRQRRHREVHGIHMLTLQACNRLAQVPSQPTLMSITQPSTKSRMFIRFERGYGAPASRRTGVRGKAPATHTGDTISEVLERICPSSRESAQKSAGSDTKFAKSAIEVTEVYFCFRGFE